jgi:hypothetical protein
MRSEREMRLARRNFILASQLFLCLEMYLLDSYQEEFRQT